MATSILKGVSEPTILFTIGRMNPPTPGHMFIIEQLIVRSLHLGQTKFGIILSHTTKPPDKNPLDCEQKRRYLLSGMIDMLKEQMKSKEFDPPLTPESIDAIIPIVICMDDPTDPVFGKHPIIKSVNKLLTDFNYPEIPVRMELVIGSDRSETSESSGYAFIRDSLSRKNPPVILEITSLARDEMEVPEEDDEDIDSIPQAMSASYMRRLVKKGKREKFFNIMRRTGLSNPMITDMYQQLEDKLSIPEAKTKKKGGFKRGKRGKSRKSKRYTKSKRSRKVKK